MKKIPSRNKVIRLAWLGFSFVSLFACPVLANDGYANDGQSHGATNWAGPYAGVHVGDIWGDFTNNTGTPGPDGSSNSFIGGAQIGNNWQINHIVFGVEGDASSIGLSSHNATTYYQDYMMTFRGRAGWAMDRVLPYATAGVGLTDAVAKVPGQSSAAQLQSGAALGAGVDFMMDRWTDAWMPSGNWIGRVEYLHVDVPNGTTAGGPTAIRGGSDNNLIRVGLNYKF